MIDFNTVHINNSDIKILTDKSIFNGQSDLLRYSDGIGPEKNMIIYTLDSTFFIDLGNPDPAIEITVVTKYQPHYQTPQPQTLRQMVEAHFFQTQVIISLNLVKEGFGEKLLFPNEQQLIERTNLLSGLQNRFFSLNPNP